MTAYDFTAFTSHDLRTALWQVVHPREGQDAERVEALFVEVEARCRELARLRDVTAIQQIHELRIRSLVAAAPDETTEDAVQQLLTSNYEHAREATGAKPPPETDELRRQRNRFRAELQQLHTAAEDALEFLNELGLHPDDADMRVELRRTVRDAGDALEQERER